MRRRLRVACWWALSAATITSGGACGGADVSAPPRVASVSVTPTAPSLEVGGSLPLSVQLRDAGGGVIEQATVFWSSSNPSVATISVSGVVNAVAPGAAQIAASAGGTSAVAAITVRPRAVATVAVLPVSADLRIGDTLLLRARALDSDNGELTDRDFAWSSSNAAIASVSEAGLVTAIAPGAATITASSEGRSTGVAITVTSVPVASVSVIPELDTMRINDVMALTVVLRDAEGQTLSGRGVTWNSTNSQVASVSSSGVVTAIAPGSTQVMAQSEGRSGVATIVVIRQAVASLSLIPNDATLFAGSTVPLAVTILDAFGATLTDRIVTFESSDRLIASVNPSGLIAARAPGTVTITAFCEEQSSTATIRVLAAPVVQVQVTPAVLTLFPGNAQALATVALSAGGDTLPERTATWQSGDTTVARVSADGVVTAVAPGVTVVLATIGGITGSASITVQSPTVGSVTVLPGSLQVPLGQRQQLTATVRDVNGNVLLNRPVVWSSTNEAIVFVTSTGELITLQRGTVTINATAEGIGGFVFVTVF